MAESKKYWVWLGAMAGINSKKAALLLERYKDPMGVFEASRAELSELDFLNGAAIAQLLDKNVRRNINDVTAMIFRKGIDVITIDDDEYPGNLKMAYDPPICLFRRGKPLGGKDFVAVVGTRHPSAYGQQVAWMLAGELAMHGYTVVSGLAMGIDATAHRSALAAGGETVAVLGCGVDKAYPVSNTKLMDDIVKNGTVYSEFLPGSLPLRSNFPRRNRIISGISIATVVVEAGIKSGAIITAGFAAEQGKDVFSVPGNITSPLSAGTNALISDGAIPVTCTGDILFALDPFFHAPSGKGPVSALADKGVDSAACLESEGRAGCVGGGSRAGCKDRNDSEGRGAAKGRTLGAIGKPPGSGKGRPAAPIGGGVRLSSLNSVERKIVDYIQKTGPSKMEDIISGCRSGGGEANSAVILLEMKGVLKLLPGMYYGF